MTTPNMITKAAAILHRGGLVAFPTETVYGLGADAQNEAALRAIFRVKARPQDHPLIVHLASQAHLEAWARDISPAARALAQAFWPGPLTLVLNKQPGVLDLLTAGQPTIGLRIPKHPLAQALLQTFGKAIAAPSANKFTHISPTTAAAVEQELGTAVDLIIDGGNCAIGLESTIVDMSGTTPVILRPGMITAEEIGAVLGHAIFPASSATATRAPGMHHLHYAPNTRTLLQTATDIYAYLRNCSQSNFTQTVSMSIMIHSQDLLTAITREIKLPDHITLLPMPANANDYAHDLYHLLRLQDQRNLDQIIIETVPNDPNWDAIRDRLFKATAAR